MLEADSASMGLVVGRSSGTNPLPVGGMPGRSIQTWPRPPGSSSLLVIQAHGSKTTTSEERVAHRKFLVNQWSHAHAFRDELSHHLVFTKNDEEPNGIKLSPKQSQNREVIEL